MSQSVTWVIPCYNEAERLDGAAFQPMLAGAEAMHLLFVDDGSADNTRDKLDAIQRAHPDGIDILGLPENRGKSEAVRRGMLAAMEAGSDIVGFADADLATPTEELSRLAEEIRLSNAKVLMGARVALLGRDIERKAMRHYLGRVFASAASYILRLRVYDTQCGAKLFRSGPNLQAALAEPFLSRWAFDIELLGRLMIGADGTEPLTAEQIIEEPLRQWTDIPGSKMNLMQMFGVVFDLARIARDLSRRRKGRGS